MTNLSARTAQEKRPSRPGDRTPYRWEKFLPDAWSTQVETPLYVDHFREYEMPAQRTVGYDAADKPCFTAHQFALTQLISDDDEEFYEAISYYEEMAAWRLRDGRWLVFRAINTIQCKSPHSFYVISPTMPR